MTLILATDPHRLAAAEQLQESLIEALVWFYKEIYDGTGKPAWVSQAREALGESLVGADASLYRREQAVDRALDEAR